MEFVFRTEINLIVAAVVELGPGVIILQVQDYSLSLILTVLHIAFQFLDFHLLLLFITNKSVAKYRRLPLKAGNKST